MKYEKKDFPRLYGTLYAIGVNSVIWIDGEEQIEIEILKLCENLYTQNINALLKNMEP